MSRTNNTSTVSDSVLAHVSTEEKIALRHLAASRGTTLSRAVRVLIQAALAEQALEDQATR